MTPPYSHCLSAHFTLLLTQENTFQKQYHGAVIEQPPKLFVRRRVTSSVYVLCLEAWLNVNIKCCCHHITWYYSGYDQWCSGVYPSICIESIGSVSVFTATVSWSLPTYFLITTSLAMTHLARQGIAEIRRFLTTTSLFTV